MRIFTIILSVILIIMSAVLMIAQAIMGACGIILGIILIILSRKKKIPTSNNEQYSFQVAGLYYYVENTKGLRAFEDLSCELIPEPTNEHDPNAIKVIVEGKHIGYVPADQCEEVRTILDTKNIKYMDAFGTADEYVWEQADVFITYERSQK